MAIPAASGYPQFSGNLIHPMFSTELLVQFYCQTIFNEISTTQYNGEISKCGDQVTFFREPEVEVRTYAKNQPLEHDTPTVESTTMTIDHAKYFSFKYDRIDQQQICNYEALISAVTRRAAYAIKREIDPELLTQMWTDAALTNRGNTAGEQTGSYPLGAPGADIQITSSNINAVFSRIPAVLEEACAPCGPTSDGGNGIFVVVPAIAKQIIANSDLKAGYFAGGDLRSPYLTGVEKLIGPGWNGMDIYASRFLPSVIDGTTGRRAWLVVAGCKMATGFAMTLDETRTVEHPDFFGTLYQGLAVYGFKVLYPKALVALYVSFTAS